MPIEENHYGLRDIQCTLLRMVEQVDRVCRRHGIKYSLYGAAMLGAIRDGGFIPWEDELALVFTRDALDHLLEIFPFECVEFTIAETETWAMRVVPRDVFDDWHPFIDLLHYEAICNNRVRRSFKILRLRILQGMLKEPIEYEHYSAFNRASLFLTHLLGLPFTRQQKLRRYRRISRYAARGNGAMVHISDDCFLGLGRIYSGTCVDAFEDIEFEDITLSISSAYQQMLCAKYGADYMDLPPPSQRTPAHQVERSMVG